MAPKESSEINMSGIPVAGVGGLGLLAVTLVMTIYYPQAWWLLAFGAIGGVALGAALIFYRRHHRETGPSGDDPTILFRGESAEPETVTRARDTVRPGIEELIAVR